MLTRLQLVELYLVRSILTPHNETYVDGVWLPSVTTIMAVAEKPWLKVWRERWGVLAERKMKIASAIGTEFHRCIETWLETKRYTVMAPDSDGYIMPSLIPRIEGMMKSWLMWAESIDGIVHHTELSVISRKYKYSGTLDCIMTLRTSHAK